MYVPVQVICSLRENRELCDDQSIGYVPSLTTVLYEVSLVCIDLLVT